MSYGRTTFVAACAVALAALVPVVVGQDAALAAPSLPPGFSDTVVKTGLNFPGALAFAPDGRVFVGDRTGVVKVYDNLADNTATTVMDLSVSVYNQYDRGLLGLALDPQFPTRPYLYVLYTFDAAIGGTAPRWGVPPKQWDDCPTPPGINTGGCIASARLSKLTLSGNTATAEQVLVNDWCIQFSTHTIGSLQFGPDGYLYASGGDGAGYLAIDYGQTQNICGDPPSAAGTNLTPPTAKGGALRSQSPRRALNENASLDGTIIRIDPDTGEGAPGNPMINSTDPNRRRIWAYGMRNPLRFTFRPGTSDIYFGDVGWQTWEEINKIPGGTGGIAENYGWPCYEGVGRQAGYDGADLSVCETLYAQGTSGVVAPHFTYRHSDPVVPGDGCPVGSSSSTGVAFVANPTWPAPYRNALFFADYSRGCIWAMTPDANGEPNPAAIVKFESGAVGPTWLQTGPDGNLYYLDIEGGTLHRISYTGNTPPIAAAMASPQSGAVPLTVQFDASTSSDPDGDLPLTYAWDLDADGEFDDATSVSPSATYTVAGTVQVQVRVTDTRGASSLATVTVSPGNTPPVPTITTPLAASTWAVGDLVSFSGAATDAQQGALPPTSLSWELIMQHCPSNCHEHQFGSWPGVASGSFAAPDHEYPSHLELRLTATDAGGLSTTVSRRLDPRTVDLLFTSTPVGLEVTVGATTSPSPVTHRVIVGSALSVGAATPQTIAGASYSFASWSDGGARTHTITAPANNATYQVAFVAAGCALGTYRAEYYVGRTLSGTPATGCEVAPPAYDWAWSGPSALGSPADNFSARWTGTQTYPAGPHTFWVSASDGVRLIVDGTVLIDQWNDRTTPATFAATTNLTAGNHTVVMEYYERTGRAVARLQHAPVPVPACATTSFRVEYYANPTLGGIPTTSGCDATINETWAGAPPNSGLPVDNFSTRYTRTDTFAARQYTFTIRGDDGIRLWIDGVLVLNGWSDHLPTSYSTQYMMTAGAHTVVVEHYDRTGSARVLFTYV